MHNSNKMQKNGEIERNGDVVYLQTASYFIGYLSC